MHMWTQKGRGGWDKQRIALAHITTTCKTESQWEPDG